MKRYSFIGSLLLLPLLKVFGKSKNPLAEACKTQADQEGPYYKGGAPLRTVIESEGERLTIQGVIVKASDCSTPVSGAVVDIWHCDAKGRYDNDGFKCRGVKVRQKRKICFYDNFSTFIWIPAKAHSY